MAGVAGDASTSSPYNVSVSRNVFFELTRAFNRTGPVAILASGQAVVYYRVAIMSKDGDWVVRESADACATVREVLAERGARYRPGAPLDPRWLAAGWSSHFEFTDDEHRRIRCDFFSRPPRVPRTTIEQSFARASDPLAVVDVESLIRMKYTQRAKDYAVIGELAARLAPEREIALSTDPDRLLALAPTHGLGSGRAAVEAACRGDRDAVVVALAREQDRRQQRDRARLDRFAAAAVDYLRAFAQLRADERALPHGHGPVCALAERLLPTVVSAPEDVDADVE